MSSNSHSHQGYFDQLAADGYILSIHGPRSGAVSITEQGTANLVEKYGLSQSAIDSALSNGAADQRLSLAEVLRSYRSPTVGASELISQAKDHLAVVEGSAPVDDPDTTPKGPAN